MVTQDIVSVIVTGKNASVTISECLESILHAKSPVGGFEVIYVDGESTDGSLGVIKKIAGEYRELRCFVEPGLPGRGRNRGIRESKGQIIAFTDADCLVHQSWLVSIVSHLASQGNDVVGVGGPCLAPQFDSGFAKYVSRLWETSFGSGGARNPARYGGLRFVDHNPTCNSAYRRWVFNKIGFFNQLLPVTEDVELDTRIRRHGYRLLYAEDVVVWHRRKNTFNSFAKQMYSYGYWRAHSGKKGMVPLKPLHFAPTLLVLYFAALPFLASVDLRLSMIPLAAYCAFAAFSILSVARGSGDILRVPMVLGLGLFEHVSYGFGFILGLIQDGKAGL